MLNIHDLGAIVIAHTVHATSPSKTVRKWDGRTPYYVHPIWCATTLLTETTLPEELRTAGATALLYHDVLEDTVIPLPKWLTPEVETLIRDMTFADSAEEMLRIWSKTPVVRLLKLYDKVSNLLDGAWMSTEKRAAYITYTQRLCADVVQHYGELNITRIARTVCGQP